MQHSITCPGSGRMEQDRKGETAPYLSIIQSVCVSVFPFIPDPFSAPSVHATALRVRGPIIRPIPGAA